MGRVPLDDAAALFGTLSDFFHVAVHSILFCRGLYPERTFLSATAFGVPVHQSRHPQVCAWISDAVDHIMAQMAGGDVETVAVVVHAPFARRAGGCGPDARNDVPLDRPPDLPPDLPPGAVLERWVFDVRHLPPWPGGAEALRQALHPKPTARIGKSSSSSSSSRQPARRGRKGKEGSGSPKKRPAPDRAAEKAVDKRQRRRDPPFRDDDVRMEDEEGDDADHDGIDTEEMQEYDDDDDDDDSHDDDDDDDDDDTESEAELGGDVDVRRRLADTETTEAILTPTYSDAARADLHHQLRAAVQRLVQAASALAPLPPRCTFTMALQVGDGSELRQAGGPGAAHRSTAWIPEESAAAAQARPSGKGKQKWAAAAAAATTSTSTTTTTTIRTVDAAPLFMECWVEESNILTNKDKDRTATAPLHGFKDSLDFSLMPAPPPKGRPTAGGQNSVIRRHHE